MNPINIDLVRNKDGNAIVNWSGVLAFSLIVAMVSMVGAAAFMLAVGWFSLACLLYTSPSPRDRTRSRMPSSA